jgi:hypothetical protein
MVKESGISSVDKKERRKSGYMPSAGGSFLPAGAVETTDVKKSSGEQSERAKAIAAKFGGGAKKVCHTCEQRVFALEEVVVESADGTTLHFHKTCLKCKECSSILRTETLVQVGEDIFCKTHGKERQKEFRKSTNYGDSESSAKASSLAKKLGGASNKCVVCDKACYMTDGLEVSAGTESLHVHKSCFLCAEEECPKKLTIESYVRVGHSFYCKNHGADAQGIRGRGISVTHGAGASFLPEGAVESTDVKRGGGEQSERSKAIAAKLGGTSEKCEICAKTVYQLEKVSVESSNETTIVHKSCFKCSEGSCGTSLTLGTYVKSDGAYFCKTHAPKGQAVRDGGMYTAVMGEGDGKLSAAAGSADEEPVRDEHDVDPEPEPEQEEAEEEPEPQPESEPEAEPEEEEAEPEPEAAAEEEAVEEEEEVETDIADGHEEAEPEEPTPVEAAVGESSGFDADAERERRKAEREAERAARRAAEEAEEAEREERRRQREAERAARRAEEE